MNDYLSEQRKSRLVVELSRALDRAIDEFAEEHEALIRDACAVGDEVERVRSPAVLAFLGHTLWRVYDTRGRDAAIALCHQLLDEFARLPSRSSQVSPSGEKLDG